MGDPYWRYGPSADRASVPRPAFPGYLPSDVSTLSSQPLWPSHNQLSTSSDFLQKDILAPRPGAYGADDIRSTGVPPESSLNGYTAGASSNGYPPVWEDPYLGGRRDVIHGTGPAVPDIVHERADVLPAGSRESNVLFVDALPSDCSRREVSHLFRPFLGFKEIRLVHKEPRHSEDRAVVLCFVEFSDSNHALTALEALQGYKFDNKKPDSSSLRIHFAHFPFELPPDREERNLTIPRERELIVGDEGTVVVKRKFEGSPPKSSKKRCEKCNKRHFGDCLINSKCCFRCGKPGHVCRECPTNATRSVCYSCGVPGHIRVDCPKLKIDDSMPPEK